MTLQPQTAARRLTRGDLACLIGLLITGIFLAVRITRLPIIVGYYGDDGVYLATARALAQGEGYRHPELPGRPYQTKYPVIYPLGLTLLWRLAPDFPENTRVLRVANIGLWALGSWLAYRWLRKGWNLASWVAGLGTWLAFTNLNTVDLLRTAMSEPLYFTLSMAALLIAGRADPGPSEAVVRRPAWAVAAISGVLAAASYLTRCIGLSLVAALLIHSALHRRWRALVALAVGPGLAVLGWELWCRQAAAENALNPAAQALRYELDYWTWFPGIGKLAWVAYHNLSDLGLTLCELLAPLWTGDQIANLLSGGPIKAWPLYAGMILSATALAAGLAATRSRRSAAGHSYLLLYCGLVLIWPFPPTRFVLPILPLILAAQLKGMFFIMTRLAKPVAGLVSVWRAPRAAQSRREARGVGGQEAAAIVVILIAAGLGCARLRPLLGWGCDIGTPGGLDLAGREEAVALLLAHTPPEAVISANDAGYLHLRTGRKVISPLPHDDPVSVYYPADRKFSQCGRVVTPGMARADREHAQRHLVAYLRNTRADFVVPLDRRYQSYWAAFEPLCRSQPPQARLVASRGRYSLYSLSLRADDLAGSPGAR